MNIAFDFVYLLASFNTSSLKYGFFLILDLWYSSGNGVMRYTLFGPDGNMATCKYYPKHTLCMYPTKVSTPLKICKTLLYLFIGQLYRN